MSLATSSPGAQTPKTPQASCGPFSPGRRSCVSRPSPRATCAQSPTAAAASAAALQQDRQDRGRAAPRRGRRDSPRTRTAEEPPQLRRSSCRSPGVLAEVGEATRRRSRGSPPVAMKATKFGPATDGWHGSRPTLPAHRGAPDPYPSDSMAGTNDTHAADRDRPSASGTPCAASSPPPPGWRWVTSSPRSSTPRLARARRGLHRHRRHAHPGQGVGGRDVRHRRQAGPARQRHPRHRPRRRRHRAGGAPRPSLASILSSWLLAGLAGLAALLRGRRLAGRRPARRSPPRGGVAVLHRAARLPRGRPAQPRAAPRRRAARVAARPHGIRRRRAGDDRPPHLPPRRRRRSRSAPPRSAPSAQLLAAARDAAGLGRPCPPPRAPRGPLPTGLEGKVKGISPFRTAATHVLPRRHRPGHPAGRRRQLEARGRRRWSTGRSRSPSTSSLKMPMIERDITLTCVSNEVGGPLRRRGPLAGRARQRPARARRRPGRRRPDLQRPSTDGMTISPRWRR